MAKTMAKTKRGPGRPRKTPRVREENIVTKKDEDGMVKCPRCGESVSVLLRHRSTAGICRYTCYSEDCKKNGPVKGRGRGFIIRAAPSWK